MRLYTSDRRVQRRYEPYGMTVKEMLLMVVKDSLSMTVCTAASAALKNACILTKQLVVAFLFKL